MQKNTAPISALGFAGTCTGENLLPGTQNGAGSGQPEGGFPMESDAEN